MSTTGPEFVLTSSFLGITRVKKEVKIDEGSEAKLSKKIIENGESKKKNQSKKNLNDLQNNNDGDCDYNNGDSGDDNFTGNNSLTNDKNEKGIPCKVCNKLFPNRYYQRKHMLRDHEDQLYECRVCSFTSVDPEKMKNHILRVHVAKKEKIICKTPFELQETEQLMDRRSPRKIMMEDGVALGRESTTPVQYVCAICCQIYNSKFSLERHVRCHTLEKPFKCEVCSFTSSYKEHLSRHMTAVHLIVHSDAPKPKYACSKKVRSENDENDNETNPKMRKMAHQRFECAVCGQKSTHKTQLIQHIQAKHPNAHIQSMKNEDGSKVHLVVSAPKQKPLSKKMSIKCPHCLLEFHDNWKYKVHLRSHTGVKPYNCSLCAFKATSKMTVRDHVHRKHKEYLDTARIIIRTIGIDGQEEVIELPVPLREFKCDDCDILFEDKYNLRVHKEKLHSDQLPFSCTACQFRSNNKASLIVHCLNMHPNDKVVNIMLKNGRSFQIGAINLPQCDICSKLFAYRSQLIAHNKYHTGERTFKCDHCSFSTNVKTNLINHVKIHFKATNASKRVKVVKNGTENIKINLQKRKISVKKQKNKEVRKKSLDLIVKKLKKKQKVRKLVIKKGTNFEKQ